MLYEFYQSIYRKYVREIKIVQTYLVALDKINLSSNYKQSRIDPICFPHMSS